jgi:pseudouridine kinase
MIPKIITVVGGAHIDRRGRIGGDTKPGSSNPGQWLEEAGGGGFNAARDLALLGHNVTMISASGGDAAGDMVADAAEQTGVTLSNFIFLDRQTPSYTAILERDGNLVIALADMALYDLMTPRRLTMRSLRDRLDISDLVICDANLPGETIFALASTLAEKNIPLAAIGVSPAKVMRLKKSLPLISYLFMNEAEAKALSGLEPQDARTWPDIMRGLGLGGGAMTRGMKPTIAWNPSTAAELTPPSVETIGDVTGAGDAFAAGALHAFMQGMTLPDMMRHGAALALLAVLSPLAVPEELDPSLLAESLTLVPAPETLA